MLKSLLGGKEAAQKESPTKPENSSALDDFFSSLKQRVAEFADRSDPESVENLKRKIIAVVEETCPPNIEEDEPEEEEEEEERDPLSEINEPQKDSKDLL